MLLQFRQHKFAWGLGAAVLMVGFGGALGSVCAAEPTIQLGGAPIPVYKLLPADVTDNLFLVAPTPKVADARNNATGPQFSFDHNSSQYSSPTKSAAGVDPDCGDPTNRDRSLSWRKPGQDDIADAFGAVIAPPSARESEQHTEPAPLELAGPELAPLAPTTGTIPPVEPIAKSLAPVPATVPVVEQPAKTEPQPIGVETPATTTPSATFAPAKSPIAPVTTPAVATLPPLSRNMQFLRTRLRSVLKHYYERPLCSDENDPWESMHGMLSFELHSKIRNGGRQSEPVTAIGHLCFNRPCKGMMLLRVDKDGDLAPRIGVGLQGHEGQFLAMLAQCNVTPEYPIRVEGREFTIRDLIRSEQKSCRSRTELTFKLIGLRHYLPADTSWIAEDGQRWDIPRLIREERHQPIRGAACGGTHRLSGLSLAYQTRIARGEPVDGEYLEAKKFVTQYQNYCFSMQNEDGSLSTEWFRGPGDEEDIERRLRTTGHQVEWLAYSLPDDKLQYYRMVRAVNYLVNLLAANPNKDWHNGSRAHALHALVVYDKRLFIPYDNQPQVAVATETRPQATTAKRTAPTARRYVTGNRRVTTTQRRAMNRSR